MAPFGYVHLLLNDLNFLISILNVRCSVGLELAVRLNFHVYLNIPSVV